MPILCINKIFKVLWKLGVLNTFAIVRAATTTEHYTTNKIYYEMKAICKEHKIIPDVVSHVPEQKVEVAFNGQNGDFVNFGNYLTIDQIQKIPPRIVWPHLPNILYTLMLISPDYPTREDPKEKEWQYWVVTNIHGGDLKMGHTLTEYAPPTSIEGQVPHRMVFLVFSQRTEHAVKFLEPILRKKTISKERANFSAREFADKYNFPELVAVNFFLMKPTNTTHFKG